MSYRGAGRGYKSYRDRGAQNGRSHRVPFSADSQSDLDESEDVRLPDIEQNKTQLRERRPQRKGAKFDSRIPLPERSRNDFGKREPRARNFDDSNAELPNSSSDFTERNQRKSRINAVKRITFYRNGDKHFKGVEMVVSKQRYRSLDAIIDELSKAIPLPYGVRTVFTPGGTSITNINQLEDGRYYICSSGDQLIRNVDYGKKREKARSYDSERLSDASNSTSSSSRNSKISVASNGNLKPRVITVISGHDRNKKSKVLLNRKTVKSFEDVLKDISEILRYKVRELYTLQNVKVKGLSELFHDQDTFLAASPEKGFKRNLSNPSSLSSNGNSASPALSKRLQKSRKKSRHESLGTHNQVVTIKVKGQMHTYHHPSELDQFTVDNAPVSPPDAKLQLSWVYGYHGKDTYNNLHVLPSGEMLYFVATMVVIYNKTTNTQRHYTGHADDIKCLAVHPNQWYIATGQVSGLSVDQNELSHIRIWDAETLITLAVLALDEYSLSVYCLSFSQEDNGKQLACVDASDEDYHLTVLEWEDRAITQQSKGQSSAIVAVAFDPDDSRTIVTCGKEHVYFWRLTNTRMERKSGHFEKNEIPQFITCLEFSPNGDVITGDSNGSIMVWGKVSKKIKFVVKNAHEKSILCLRLLENGTLLTGGLDGKLASWDANKYFNTQLQEIQVEESVGGVCSVEPVHTGHGDDISILVGLTSNDMVEGSFSAPFHPIVQSHKDAVDALAVHPDEIQFVSASLDHSVSLWNAESHQVIWKVHVEFPVKSADFYSTGDVLALGTSVGRWIVLSCESGMHVASFQDGTTPLTDLEYARDGEHIAVASEDGNVYVHAVYDEGTTYRRVGCCSGHTAPVMFLDWSLDGCFLQSLSTAYEHIIWEIGGFQREESQDIIRDIEWSTRNVMLGYDVAGVWPPQPDDGNLVNSSDLSWSRDLFAVGDEMGYIRLFRFPCTQPGAHYHQWRGHSCPVERMLFLTSDTYLITTGGRDICILQWSVEAQLPMLNEQEEYGNEGDMHQMEDSQRHLENESYHSDYSDNEQDDEDYGFSRNAAKGRQDGGVKASLKNDRYARGVDVMTLEVPRGHGHTKTLQKNQSNRQTSLEKEKERSRRPPLPIQKKTGSYAERFNKQKSLGNQNGNMNWSHDSADRSPVEPQGTGQWSDSEDPQEHGKRQMGRGGARSRYPGRGRDRRPMR